MLGSEEPEVLLLDLMLPDMDGREVLRSLAAQRPLSLKAVFVLTGDLMSTRAEEMMSLGVDAFVPKPVDMSALVRMIQDVIKK